MTFVFVLGAEPHTVWSEAAVEGLVGQRVLVGPFQPEDGSHVGMIVAAEGLGVGEGVRVTLDVPELGEWLPSDGWLSVGLTNPVIL